jgi:hypothetical protein
MQEFGASLASGLLSIRGMLGYRKGAWFLKSSLQHAFVRFGRKPAMTHLMLLKRAVSAPVPC